MTAPAPASFADLLASAVTEPGIVSSAYRQFHTYSIGNPSRRSIERDQSFGAGRVALRHYADYARIFGASLTGSLIPKQLMEQYLGHRQPRPGPQNFNARSD